MHGVHAFRGQPLHGQGKTLTVIPETLVDRRREQ